MKHLTFADLYEVEKNKPKPPTAAQLFIARVAAAARVDENTVRNWISGRQQPRGAALAAVAKYLGVPEETLFPTVTV